MTGAGGSGRLDVVVLGAGPAGLAAGWYALRRGLRVAVVDRAAEVGGLAASLSIDGQRVDLGSHRLHPSIRPDLLADLRGPLGIDLQWRPRHGRIRLHDRWLSFPLRPADVVRNSSARFAAGVLRDTALAPLRRSGHLRGSDVRQPTFDAEVRRHLGPTIAEGFYGPYARKLWASEPTDLSAELFRRRVGTTSITALLARLVSRRPAPGFWYPTAGFGAICDALATSSRGAGGELLTGAELASVAFDEDGARVELRGGRTISSRTVISTIPSADLAELTGAPADVVAAGRALASRAAVLIYLTVARPRCTAFDAHYFPEPTTIVSRLSEPKNYRCSPDDPADRTVLCAEVPAAVGDRTWAEDDDVLAGRVVEQLRLSGLPDLTTRAAQVVRRTNVYPIYRVGFERHRDRVDAHLAGLPHLAVLGRQALFAHDNTHHALLMGRTVVDALGSDARLDRARWDRLRADFADHTVED